MASERPDTHELACSGVAPTVCAAAKMIGSVPPAPAMVATKAAAATETNPPDFTTDSYLLAVSTIACRRICAPAPTSSRVASSISLWLMPSLHGTKIMAVGATRLT